MAAKRKQTTDNQTEVTETQSNQDTTDQSTKDQSKDQDTKTTTKFGSVSSSNVDYSLMSSSELAKETVGQVLSVMSSFGDVLKSTAKLSCTYLDGATIMKEATLESDIDLELTKNQVKKRKIMNSLEADQSVKDDVEKAMAKIKHLLP